MNARKRRFWGGKPLAVVVTVILGTIAGLPAWTLRPVMAAEEAEKSNPSAAADSRKKELGEMRRRAEATVVQQSAEGEKPRAKLSAEPLFRYSDQPRRITDAALWGYSIGGRPVALQKIEALNRPGHPKWFYCFASFSEGLPEVQWLDGNRWAAAKPGIELRPLEQGPEPAKTAAGRLRQMKEQVQRFSATLTDIAAGREEIRLMSTPIWRYSAAESGIQDGAVFGFATNGTNPDLLLLIEIDGKEPGKPSWRYAPVRMTVAGLSVRLDKKEVWTVPYVHAPEPGQVAAFETWVFFFEKEDPSP